MVLISHEYKYIFIHIPKTCGQTIKASMPYDLKESCEWFGLKNLDSRCFKNYKFRNLYHLSYKEIEEIYPYINTNEYFIFTFVRNPYDRLYSTYLYLKKHSLSILLKLILISIIIIILLSLILKRFKLGNYIIILPIISLIIFSKYIKFNYELYSQDFNTFIANNFENLNNISPMVLAPQYTYVEGVKLDFVGKEESFDKDFEYIRNLFNINNPIKTVNVIEERKDTTFYKYIEKYNKKTIDFVNEYYKKDFEIFNYKCLKI